MTKLAWIGLGVMGFPMAGHLARKSGLNATVYNRTDTKAKAWVEKNGGVTAASPKADDAMRISWDFIQLTLPFSVLISPLWASMRKGCASHHCGKVLVE